MQHPFVTKTPSKVGTGGKCLELPELRADTYTRGERTLHPKTGTERGSQHPYFASCGRREKEGVALRQRGGNRLYSKRRGRRRRGPQRTHDEAHGPGK